MFSAGLGLSLATAARDGTRETIGRNGASPDVGQRETSKRWLWDNTVAQAPAWDLIPATDLDAFASYDYAGFISFEWPTVGNQSTYVFNVNFTDGVSAVKLAMNPSYGSQAAAEVDVLKYVHPLGKMPTLFRQNLNHVLCYQGDGAFSSEDRGHFFICYGDRADVRIAANKLEDSFFHECVHSTIQRLSGGKGEDWIFSPEWINARRLDNAYITEYAGEADQEDLAESGLMAFTMIFNPDRFTDDERAFIRQQIPNRIDFFYQHIFQWLLMTGAWSDVGFWDDNSAWSD